MKKLTLLLNCNDKEGIIAEVTKFVYKHKGNIVYIDQHVDRENSIFFMRLECEFKTKDFNQDTFTSDFKASLVKEFNLNWEILSSEHKQQMAVFVSKYDHCLYDILGRYKSGELNVEIPFIISNHKDLEHIANKFEIPFYHVPVIKGQKYLAEQEHIEILKKHNVDFIILARYMQIIPESLITLYPNKVINIHHSFLPAFVGAKPYHSAYKRGVKIIGATSHYVTEDLDEGPIIEQDVARVSHSHSIKDLVANGRDLEKIVFARGIKLHIDRKVMVYNNKTIIFS